MQLKVARCPACGHEVPYVARDPGNEAIIRREYLRTVISLGLWILHECAGSWWIEANGPAR
jgi:hypothetical protein